MTLSGALVGEGIGDNDPLCLANAIHINALASQWGGESLRQTVGATPSERDRVPSLAPPDRGWGWGGTPMGPRASRAWDPTSPVKPRMAGSPPMPPFLCTKTAAPRFRYAKATGHLDD